MEPTNSMQSTNEIDVSRVFNAIAEIMSKRHNVKVSVKSIKNVKQAS